MPVPPYTIRYQPSSSGTALVDRTSVSLPRKQAGVQGFLRPGPQKISVLRMIKHDTFSWGHPLPRSMGLLVPHAKQHIPFRGIIPQRYCILESLLETYTCHRYFSRKCPSSISWHDLSPDSSWNPARST
jgi:hypothetical protein